MLLHCWDGFERVIRICLLSSRHDAQNWGQTVQFWFHQTRESCFSQFESYCFFFLLLLFFFQAGCLFTEERLPSGHSAINPRLVECCSDGCPSGSFSRLHTGSPELSKSDHRILGPLSYQGPSPPIAQFGRAASSSKSPGCSELLSFKNYGGHCALGNIQCIRFFLSPSPDLCLQYNPVSELCRQLLGLHGLVFALICIVSCETWYIQVRAFPHHV